MWVRAASVRECMRECVAASVWVRVDGAAWAAWARLRGRGGLAGECVAGRAQTYAREWERAFIALHMQGNLVSRTHSREFTSGMYVHVRICCRLCAGARAGVGTGVYDVHMRADAGLWTCSRGRL